MEKWIKDTDLELEINYDVTIQQQNFFDTYQGRKGELEKLYAQWEDLESQIESLN